LKAILNAKEQEEKLKVSKFFKWVGIILGSLIGLLAVTVFGIYIFTGSLLNQSYIVADSQITIPTDDTAAVQRGQHLVTTVGFCQECHGDNLAGQVMEDDPLFGRLAASNLTSGEGGIGRTYRDEDYVRAIRHGVGPDGKSLLIMPSNLYYTFGDEDLAAIVAYLKSLPPTDNALPPTTIGPIGRLYLLVDPSLLPAQVISHTTPHPGAPKPEISAAYGEYLAVACKTCHGPNLAGLPGEGGGSNITPGSQVGAWTEDDFIRAMRSGVTPDGEALDAELMPWPTLGQLTDEELKAIWVYLQSLPPVRTVVTPKATKR
jgi:mono/diheme cytochrome c family protein